MIELQKNRNTYIDTLKGSLIILVVFGHFLELFLSIPIIYALYSWIYIFHMPLFIFCSGYLERGDFKRTLKQLVPMYVVFNVLYILVAYVFLRQEVDLFFIQPYWIMWYLLSLLGWNLISHIIPNVNGVIILVAFFVGLFVGFLSIDYAFSFSRTFVFFPFYLMGRWVKENKINITYFTRYKLLGLLISLGVILFLFYNPVLMPQWLYGSFNYEDGGGNILIRFVCYILSVIISISFLSLVPRKPVSFLTKIGRNTLSVYLLHGFIVLLFDEFIVSNSYNMSTIQALTEICIMTIGTIFLCQRKIIQKLFQKLFPK